MRKYKIGLLIGRFQPFHKGHLHLLKRSLHYVDRLVIGIGSANRIDDKNPLTLDLRWKMIERVIKKEDIKDRILKIVAINDYLESDQMWLKKAIEAVGKFDILIGNDEWTDGIFEKAGYKVLRLGFYKRHLYEGQKIRRFARENKFWNDRIPSYLNSKIKNDSVLSPRVSG